MCRASRVVGTIALISGSACSESSGTTAPPYAAFEGTWEGEGSSPWVLVVSDSAGDISGVGHYNGDGLADFHVSGDHEHPYVTFQASFMGPPPVVFEGEFVDVDHVEGLLHSQFDEPWPLRLARVD